jgi:hypothetical protein
MAGRPRSDVGERRTPGGSIGSGNFARPRPRASVNHCSSPVGQAALMPQATAEIPCGRISGGRADSQDLMDQAWNDARKRLPKH